MIEEMDEAGKLRSKLTWVEHDLEHVVTERDKAQDKLDDIFAIARDCFRTEGSTHEALTKIKLIARS